MDRFIEELMESGLGQFLDRSRDEFLVSDEVYREDCRREEETERKFLILNLTKEEKTVIEDYLECMRIRNHRCADLSYIAGIRDTVKFLVALGLLKGCDLEE